MRLWLFALAGCGRVGFGEPSAAGDARPAGDAVAVVDAASDAPLGVTAPPAYVSGSRLHAVAWHAGGASEFARWFDSKLGASCSAQPTTGGTRCVPTEAPLLDLFADAACSVPLYGTSVCLDGDPVPLTHESGGTVNGYRDRTVFTGQFFEMLLGGCSPVSGSWPFPLYTAGTAHGPGELAALATAAMPAGAVELAEEVSDDGAQRVTGFSDPATGMPCHLDAAAPGLAACVPDATPVSDPIFGDPGCTTPAYVLASDPPWVRVDPVDACSDDRTFMPVTGQSGAFVQNGTTCASANLAPGYKAYAVGPARARTTFPTGTLVARGSGAVQELAWVTDAIDVVVGTWDASLQVECYYGPGTGQHSRCYPQTQLSFANSWDTDASCGATQWQAASCRPPQYVPFTFSGSACDFTGVTPGAIAVPGATPYVNTGSACAPVAAPAGTTFTRWQGSDAPSSAFQPADSVLE